MLKKGAFTWTNEADRAFEELKKIMSTTPVLALPDFSIQFTVETDACKGGIGVVLMQEHIPIAYLSKALSPKHLGCLHIKKRLWLLSWQYKNGEHICKCSTLL